MFSNRSTNTMAVAPNSSSGDRRSARKLIRLIFRSLALLSILLNGLLAWLSLAEWYAVKIQGHTAGYPFGGEGPVPYYYKSADLYATVNLVWGILFLAAFTFGIWILIRRNRKSVLLATGITILMWIIYYLHGQT
jgi:hypothetical protein